MNSISKRVAFNGPDRTVYGGPFKETSELVAGFWLRQSRTWTRPSMGEAMPQPDARPSEIEIRPS